MNAVRRTDIAEAYHYGELDDNTYNVNYHSVPRPTPHDFTVRQTYFGFVPVDRIRTYT